MPLALYVIRSPPAPRPAMQFKLLDVLPTTPACVSAVKSQALDSVVACADYCLLNQWAFQVRGSSRIARQCGCVCRLVGAPHCTATALFRCAPWG